MQYSLKIKKSSWVKLVAFVLNTMLVCSVGKAMEPDRTNKNCQGANLRETLPGLGLPINLIRQTYQGERQEMFRTDEAFQGRRPTELFDEDLPDLAVPSSSVWQAHQRERQKILRQDDFWRVFNTCVEEGSEGVSLQEEVESVWLPILEDRISTREPGKEEAVVARAIIKTPLKYTDFYRKKKEDWVIDFFGTLRGPAYHPLYSHPWGKIVFAEVNDHWAHHVKDEAVVQRAMKAYMEAWNETHDPFALFGLWNVCQTHKLLNSQQKDQLQEKVIKLVLNHTWVQEELKKLLEGEGPAMDFDTPEKKDTFMFLEQPIFERASLGAFLNKLEEETQKRGGH